MKTSGRPFLPEPLPPRLLELYRRASPEQKLGVVARLNAALIELKRAELLSRHPPLAHPQLQQQLRRWWLAAAD